jgi:peptidyl-prolyl cis-trans isomerase C
MHAPVRLERNLFGRLIREPLVHFLLIGTLLFVLYGLAGAGRNSDRNIRVDDAIAATLFGQFNRTWQRPPTAEEMNALVESYVRDEIFYREGVGLGLDRDDPTIKRRISQKFATIAEEYESAEVPTDAELEARMKRHPDRYAKPALVTFDQITFDGTAEGMAALESARKALKAGADPRTMGQGRMLLPHFELYPIDLVQRDFGPDFARAIAAVRPGQWQGPVKSGYGVHLVRVNKVMEGSAPRLSDVRAAVARDYEQDRRTRSLDATYRKLRQSYQVEYSGKWTPTRPQ